MIKERRYSRTFANIPDEKQHFIIEKAIKEFAQKGYITANINRIAKEANISIGSMYSYFPSKEALFLSIIDEGVGVLQEALKGVTDTKGGFFDKYHQMLKAAITYAKEYEYLHQIYLEISTEGLSHLATELTQSMESVTTEVYEIILAEAEASDEIRKGLDKQVVAFCLDNIAMMLQFSFASKYYYERMKLFISGERDEDELIDSIISILKNGMAP